MVYINDAVVKISLLPFALADATRKKKERRMCMCFDHQEAENCEWSMAQTAAFNRCVDFLVKMAEKYGNVIPMDKHPDYADRTGGNPCSEPGAGTYILWRDFSFTCRQRRGWTMSSSMITAA